MSLRVKLLLPLILIGILIAAYLYTIWFPRILAADEVAHIKAVDQHLNSVAESLVPLLLGNQLDILHGNLNALKKDNTNWLSILLLDPENRRLYPLATMPLEQEFSSFPDVRKVEKQVTYLGENLGTLTIMIDLASSLENTRQEIMELTFGLLAVLIIFMLTIISTIEIMVRRPVHQLAEATTHISQMNFATPLPYAGKDEIGELVRSFTSMRDDLQSNHNSLVQEINERKKAEDALKQLNETLEQRVSAEVAANRDKDHMLIQQSRLAAMGEMVHNIAHQWRQPLNSLGLLISNVLDDFKFHTLTQETLEQDVVSARRLIERMSTTIDDFRDFFRSDREKSSFDVAVAVLEATFIVEASLKSNHIELVIDAPPGLIASGFPSQYGQAVLNLLVNAKEAIREKKGADGRIQVTLKQEDGNAVLRVEDNGGGIAQEALPRLFDPYFTTKDSGTGIGLYMTKMIIERNMAGTINTENVEKGACFILTIPLETTV